MKKNDSEEILTYLMRRVIFEVFFYLFKLRSDHFM